jgi:hypothetical protein
MKNIPVKGTYNEELLIKSGNLDVKLGLCQANTLTNQNQMRPTLNVGLTFIYLFIYTWFSSGEKPQRSLIMTADLRTPIRIWDLSNTKN